MVSRLRVVRSLVAVVLALALGAAVEVVSVGTASAANPTSCTRVISGNATGSIEVGNGELVCLNRAVVTGTDGFGHAINVHPGGGLIVLSSVLHGDVNSYQAFEVIVCASRFDGNIGVDITSGLTAIGWRAQGCGGNSLPSRPAGGDIGLNINNNPGPVVVDANVISTSTAVGGFFNASGNTGGVQLTSNVDYGEMNCTSDNPAPTGSGNVATQGKFGQCASV